MNFRWLFKDAAIYGGADFVTKLISFISFPIIASVISPAEFGKLELVLTCITLSGILINCGMNNAVQRYYWDSDLSVEDRKSIVTTALLVIIVLGLLFSVLVVSFFHIFFIDLIDVKEYQFLIFSSVAIVLLNQQLQFILDILRVCFLPIKFFSLAILARAGSSIAGLYAVTILDNGVEGLLIAQALIYGTVLPLGIYFVRNELQISSISLRWTKALVEYGYPFIFAGIAYWIFSSTDRWMLLEMSSVEEVGIYSVALRFASIALFVSMAFGQAWSPFAMRLISEHPDSYRKKIGEIFLVLIFIMLIATGGISLFSGEIISFFMPELYASSVIPLIIICIGILFQSTQQVTIIGISLEKMTYMIARTSWCVAIINVALNWFLIPIYGASGAAISTVICYLIITVIYLYCTQKYHPIEIAWQRLFFLLFLGMSVFMLSIYTISYVIDLTLIITKIFVALTITVIGYRVCKLIPEKSTES